MIKEKNISFEGEYKNGKKWNGNEYDKNGNLECEFKNGNGKGKEYDYDGILIFEGEYLNGERNGKGKEYNKNGNLKFKGEYLNGKIWNGQFYNSFYLGPNNILGNIIRYLNDKIIIDD